MNATIHNIMEYLCAVLVTLAFLSSMAIRRTKRIQEPPLIETGRNLLVGGWLLLAIRLWYLAVYDTKVDMSIFGMMAFSLIALGATVVSAGRLFPLKLYRPCEECPYTAPGVVIPIIEQKEAS